MRTLLGLLLVTSLSLTGCGKKKAPAAPAPGAPAESPSGGEGGMRDEKTPDDPDDARPDGADPCDGGE